MLPYFCFQPYSLCKGRKKAFKKDVELLKSIYKNSPNYSFKSFKEAWATAQLSTIHYAIKKDENVTEYYQCLYGVILGLLELFSMIFAVYSIYTLYFTSPYEVRPPININIETLNNLKNGAFEKKLGMVTDMYIPCLLKLCSECFSYGVIEGTKTIVLDRIGHLYKKCKGMNKMAPVEEKKNDQGAESIASITTNLLKEKETLSQIDAQYHEKKKVIVEDIYSNISLKEKLINGTDIESGFAITDSKDKMLPQLFSSRCKKYKDMGMLSNLLNLADTSLPASLFNGLESCE